MTKKLLCMLLSLMLALGTVPALATGIVIGGGAPAAEETSAPQAAEPQAAGAPLAVEPAENGDVLLPGAASPVAAGGTLYFTLDGFVYSLSLIHI